MIGWMTFAWKDEKPAAKTAPAKPVKPAASNAKTSDKKTTSIAAPPQKVAGR